MDKDKVDIGKLTVKLDLDTSDAEKKLAELEKKVDAVVEKIKDARNF